MNNSHQSYALQSDPQSSAHLKLGRLSIDHTHIDCALVLKCYPGGALMEIEHRSSVTYCFTETTRPAVLLAFDDDLEHHTVHRIHPTGCKEQFIELKEKVLLLLPEEMYGAVEERFQALAAGE